jgi:hypothetical protein
MRVTSVEMYSSVFEEAVTISLQNSEPNAQYQARTILGLDAEELIPKFYGRSLNGSDKFYDFTLKPRDIVMRIVLSPRFVLDETFADVRDHLYRIISANRTGLVALHFKSGATLVARIIGSIVKFEAVHFTNLPEVQLTVRCNDPMFRAINPVIFEDTELSTINPVRVPDSLSTAPHGFAMQLTFTADSDSFTIQDDPTIPEWKFKVIPHGGFNAGDVLYFSSEFSNKYIYYVRDTVTSAPVVQLSDRVESGSIWPILFPGQNEFYFMDIASFDWNSVQYYAAYWGV